MSPFFLFILNSSTTHTLLTVRLASTPSSLDRSFYFSLGSVVFDHSSPQWICDSIKSGIFSSKEHHSYCPDSTQSLYTTFYECSTQPLSPLRVRYQFRGAARFLSAEISWLRGQQRWELLSNEGRGGWAGTAEGRSCWDSRPPPHPPLTGGRGGARGRVSHEVGGGGAPTAPQSPPRPALIVAAAAGGAPGGGWAGGSRGSLSSGTVGWGWPAWRAGTATGTARALRAARSSPQQSALRAPPTLPPSAAAAILLVTFDPRQFKGHSPFNGVVFL